AGEPAVAEIDDLLNSRILAGMQHDTGSRRLAPLIVGHAHHRHLEDLGMLCEHALDLGRIDVLAAADDHVVLAIDQMQEALLAGVAHVAAGLPLAVPDGVARRAVAVVAEEGHGRRGVDLADLTRWQLATIAVEHGEFAAEGSAADRTLACDQLLVAA